MSELLKDRSFCNIQKDTILKTKYETMKIHVFSIVVHDNNYKNISQIQGLYGMFRNFCQCNAIGDILFEFGEEIGQLRLIKNQYKYPYFNNSSGFGDQIGSPLFLGMQNKSQKQIVYHNFRSILKNFILLKIHKNKIYPSLVQTHFYYYFQCIFQPYINQRSPILLYSTIPTLGSNQTVIRESCNSDLKISYFIFCSTLDARIDKNPLRISPDYSIQYLALTLYINKSVKINWIPYQTGLSYQNYVFLIRRHSQIYSKFRIYLNCKLISLNENSNNSSNFIYFISLFHRIHQSQGQNTQAFVLSLNIILIFLINFSNIILNNIKY